MLALTDEAFARVVIGATKVRQNHRGRWLRRLARALDPPMITDNARKCRAARERAKKGQIILRFKVSEIDVAEMLENAQLLSPNAEHSRQELSAALVFFLSTWRRRLPGLESQTEPPPAEQRAA